MSFLQTRYGKNNNYKPLFLLLICNSNKFKMSITHHLNKGMEIFGSQVNWGMKRKEVRSIIGDTYEEQNSVLSLKEFDPNSEDIVTRKDIYRNYKKSNHWFVLIYSEDDAIEEFELHEAKSFLVENVKINFGESIKNAIKRISEQGVKLKSLSEEEILIPSYKTVFASSEHMGGDGDGVEYIYCSKNINHLEEA